MSLATSRGVAGSLLAGIGAGEARLAQGDDAGTAAADATPGSPGRPSGTVSAIWNDPATTPFEDWAGDMLTTGAGYDSLLFGSIFIFVGVTLQEGVRVRFEEDDAESNGRRPTM